MSKYKAKKIVVDDIKFDSIRESERYLELMFLKRTGLIKNINLQPKFNFSINGKHIFNYFADFQYFDIKQNKKIIEDVKSKATAKNPTKVSLMKQKIRNGYNTRYLWDYLIRYHNRNFKKAMSDYRKMLRTKS